MPPGKSLDELRAENEVLRDFFENAPDMFVSVCAETGTIRKCNETLVRTTGWNREELIGSSIYSVYHPDCINAVRAAFATFKKTGDVYSNELALATKSGDKIPVSLHASSVRNSRGSIIYSRSIWRDLTKYNMLKARVVNVQHAESLATLAGGIAHDFNNLLSVILGNAELAKERLAANLPEFQYVKNIESASVRASELTKQMLAYAGKGSFELTHCDLRELVEEIGRLVSSTHSPNIKFVYELGEDAVFVEADATQMRQFVMNLIRNAADSFESANGTVTIRTGTRDLTEKCIAGMTVGSSRPPGKYAFVEVRDDGCGMSTDTISRMFAPFFSTKTGDHHGLGLAATLGIVAGHFGAINVSSRIGQGTLVQVYLPESTDCRSSRQPRCVLSPRGSGVVLVVDDDALVRDVVRRGLEATGFQVIVCVDGYSAVDAFQARGNEVDVVLLDLTMPGMDGHETLRALRRLDDEIPVVIMSGHSEKNVFDEFGKGTLGFLQKPFRLDDLSKAIFEQTGC